MFMLKYLSATGGPEMENLAIKIAILATLYVPGVGNLILYLSPELAEKTIASFEKGFTRVWSRQGLNKKVSVVIFPTQCVFVLFVYLVWYIWHVFF